MFSHPNPEAYAFDASHIRVFVGEREASCLTFYSFTSLLLLILLLCLLFLCAEKSNKRKRQASTDTGVHLQGTGPAPSNIRAGQSNRFPVHGM